MLLSERDPRRNTTHRAPVLAYPKLQHVVRTGSDSAILPQYLLWLPLIPIRLSKVNLSASLSLFHITAYVALPVGWRPH